jgi:hypothetical protein
MLAIMFPFAEKAMSARLVYTEGAFSLIKEQS